MTSALQNIEAMGEQAGGSMLCPKCGAGVRCTDSRGGPRNSIRRRRRCTAPQCGFRFTTYEAVLEDAPLSPTAIAFLVDQLEATLPAVHQAIRKLKAGLAAAALVQDLSK